MGKYPPARIKKKEPEKKSVTMDILAIFILLEDPSLISPESRNCGARQTRDADWTSHLYCPTLWRIPPESPALLLSKFRARKQLDPVAELRS